MIMSVGLVGVLPAAVRDQEDDIDEQPSRSPARSRKNAALSAMTAR
jgi:hypothetical protein